METATKRITITVDPITGELVYDHERLHVQKLDQISWRFEDGAFAVQFIGTSPLERVGFRWWPGLEEMTAHVREDAQPGVYRYACAVCKEQQIYLDPACPAIIIEF